MVFKALQRTAAVPCHNSSTPRSCMKETPSLHGTFSSSCTLGMALIEASHCISNSPSLPILPVLPFDRAARRKNTTYTSPKNSPWHTGSVHLKKWMGNGDYNLACYLKEHCNISRLSLKEYQPTCTHCELTPRRILFLVCHFLFRKLSTSKSYLHRNLANTLLSVSPFHSYFLFSSSVELPVHRVNSICFPCNICPNRQR